MKKLLLLAVVAVATASQVQAVGVCTEKVQCDGSRREGETFKCAPCICPEVKCPVPAETVCECAPAQPIKKEICPEVRKCHVCHRERAHRHHGCKSGNCCSRGCAGYVEEVTVVKEAPASNASAARHHMKTPKRVQQ